MSAFQPLLSGESGTQVTPAGEVQLAGPTSREYTGLLMKCFWGWNTLNSLIYDIQGESGKYISTSCANDGVTFDAGIRLVTDLLGLIYYLEESDAAGSVRGYVVDSRASGIAGATVMIRDSKQVITTGITDPTGFYLFPAAGVLTRGVNYTVEVTALPSRATITPAYQKFTWEESSIMLDKFVAQ